MVITSNLDLDELEDHLAHSDKGGIERLKAKRIMERIRHYVDVISSRWSQPQKGKSSLKLGPCFWEYIML